MKRYSILERSGYTTYSKTDLFHTLKYLKLTKQDIIVYDDTDDKHKVILTYIENRVSFTKDVVAEMPGVLKLYAGCELGAPLE